MERALRLLIVEDNVVNQKVVSHMLRRLGYSADIAENGLEAVHAFDDQDYDLVFMDVMMPELDGLEATRRIRETLPRKRQPYIVALTANAMKGDREKCLDAGMDEYLSKPVKPEKLEWAIDCYFTHSQI